MDYYIASYNRRGSNMSGLHNVLWQCQRDVAATICSDSRTCGANHFLGFTPTNKEKVIDWLEDDGRYDAVLKDLGIVKHGNKLEWGK